jgi:hypothetical protein
LGAGMSFIIHHGGQVFFLIQFGLVLAGITLLVIFLDHEE